MSLSVPIPDQLSHLPLDARGYPIPGIVLRDKHGQPVFSANDDTKRQTWFEQELCSICGKKLHRARWLVGGPRSAFHANGAFADPPVHYPCLEYALKVCPYLAAPSYGRPVGPMQVERVIKAQGGSALVSNLGNDGIRPPVFVAVQFVGQTYARNGFGRIRTIKPKRPYRQVEYWTKGERIDDVLGASIAADYVAKYEDPAEMS